MEKDNLNISVKKRSYATRILTSLLPHFIIASIIILMSFFDRTPFTEYPLNLYLSLIPLSIILLGYLTVRASCRIYILELKQEEDSLMVRALYKDELKTYNFDLKRVKIILDTTPLGKGIQYRLQFLEGDTIVLIQYGNGFWEGYWTNSILKGVFIRLKDYNKDNHSYVLI